MAPGGVFLRAFLDITRSLLRREESKRFQGRRPESRLLGYRPKECMRSPIKRIAVIRHKMHPNTRSAAEPISKELRIV